MASRLAWFTTPQGRTAAGILFGVAACGTFAASFLPQSILIERYENFMSLRKHNKPIPLTSNLNKLWCDVLDDLNLNNYQKLLVKPFSILGFDVWHAGSLKTKYGTIVGVPINFTYNDNNDINKDSILLNNEPVNWNRDDAKRLLNSLVLSDNAKKYAMAREILMTDNYYIMIQSVANSLLVGGVYFVSSRLNEIMLLFDKPRMLRIIFYSLIASFFWVLWTSQKDVSTRHYQTKVDEYLSELNINYVKGAIEYYDKTLNRNIAMRTLMGVTGENKFTCKGNEINLMRMKNLPITSRRDFFLEKLKSETSDNTVKVTRNDVNVS